MDQSTLENWFTYNAPTPDQLPKYTAVRAAALVLAIVVNESARTARTTARPCG